MNISKTVIKFKEIKLKLKDYNDTLQKVFVLILQQSVNFNFKPFNHSMPSKSKKGRKSIFFYYSFIYIYNYIINGLSLIHFI